MKVKAPFTPVLVCIIALAGCGDKKPTENEAFQLAKKEISVALCGDKNASCFIVEGGSAKVSDKKSDGTYGVSATFESIKGKDNPLPYSEGVVYFDIDAKTEEVYIKSIEAWSADGKHSVVTCGHNYKLCRK